VFIRVSEPRSFISLCGLPLLAILAHPLRRRSVRDDGRRQRQVFCLSSLYLLIGLAPRGHTRRLARLRQCFSQHYGVGQQPILLLNSRSPLRRQ